MIDDLAAAAGIADSYSDYFGNVRLVSTQTKLAILNAMGYGVRSDRDAQHILGELSARQASRELEPVYVVGARERVELPFFTGILEPGYYEHDVAGEHTIIISTPHDAYVPRALEGTNSWGFAVQLYSLRSDRNWGIGDFGDLETFAHVATEAGAQAIALNPLHQLHAIDPARASPYSPLSRLHLNALYIDVDSAAAMLGIALAEPNLSDLRNADLINYPGVAAVKIPALRALYDTFRKHANHVLHPGFRDFQRSGGESLRNMAVYEALSAQFKRGWTQWPAPYHQPDSDAVAAYEQANAAELEFYEFLQWLADVQLSAASDAASQMPVGLYRDLAIGVDTQSADVWCDRDAYCLGISAGAPPDALNATGQNWGLPPLNPRVLRERAYAPLRAILRANMRHAGALRIDHVMGLMRLFVIPDGAPPSEGAYIAYPFRETAGVVALESRLNRCMVVGEDLGTLPPGFREEIAQRRFFGCRLLFFERNDDGSFCDPATYQHDAVASTGTHDLPPLAGFWRNLPPKDREQLLELLGEAAGDASDFEIVQAAYRVLARTGAALLLLQMEDALVQREPVNVPGTTIEAPNWRRKLPVSIEMLQDDPRFARIVAVLRDLRGAVKSS